MSDVRTPVPPPLRVLEAATTFVPGAMGGTETVFREVTRLLQGRPGLDVRVLLARGIDPATIPGAVSSRSLFTSAKTLGRLAGIAAGSLSSAGRRSGADVVHYPFSVAVPPPGSLPSVVSVHDLQHRDLPELFGPAERAFRAATYERAARRADVVLTISAFAKESIVRHLGIDPSRIVVAPLGVDAAAFAVGDDAPPREDFVLYPARGWAHKNHGALVTAMEIVRRDRPELSLLLTGGALESLPAMPDWVTVRGLVSRDELISLTQRARALAFPSRYEGFGLPPLEAMAAGTPVAVSRAASLPEIVGDAAIGFDPDDPDEIAAAILRAIDEADRLRPLGFERARQFTWEATADAHERAFRQAVER